MYTRVEGIEGLSQVSETAQKSGSSGSMKAETMSRCGNRLRTLR